MRKLITLAAVLTSATLPAMAQDAQCRDGMRWSTYQAKTPLALYSSCEGDEVFAAVACEDGRVRVAIDTELPRTEAGEPVAFDFAVDEEIYTLAGNALRSRGQVRPYLTAEASALDALMRGDRASIALPEGPLNIHLTGSARAIAPVREACQP